MASVAVARRVSDALRPSGAVEANRGGGSKTKTWWVQAEARERGRRKREAVRIREVPSTRTSS